MGLVIYITKIVWPDELGETLGIGHFFMGNVEKSRQRRSRPFAVLTYRMYAPRVKKAAALLDLPPPKRLRAGRRTFLNIPSN